MIQQTLENEKPQAPCFRVLRRFWDWRVLAENAAGGKVGGFRW